MVLWVVTRVLLCSNNLVVIGGCQGVVCGYQGVVMQL